MVDTASYHRAMWYHKKRFSAWAKRELQPLIDELVEAAKTAPQYDGAFFTSWNIISALYEGVFLSFIDC